MLDNSFSLVQSAARDRDKFIGDIYYFPASFSSYDKTEQPLRIAR
jgi:hypothetical protein